jgi:hypothetical protein
LEDKRLPLHLAFLFGLESFFGDRNQAAKKRPDEILDERVDPGPWLGTPKRLEGVAKSEERRVHRPNGSERPPRARNWTEMIMKTEEA